MPSPVRSSLRRSREGRGRKSFVLFRQKLFANLFITRAVQIIKNNFEMLSFEKQHHYSPFVEHDPSVFMSPTLFRRCHSNRILSVCSYSGNMYDTERPKNFVFDNTRDDQTGAISKSAYTILCHSSRVHCSLLNTVDKVSN